MKQDANVHDFESTWLEPVTDPLDSCEISFRWRPVNIKWSGFKNAISVQKQLNRFTYKRRKNIYLYINILGERKGSSKCEVASYRGKGKWILVRSCNRKWRIQQEKDRKREKGKEKRRKNSSSLCHSDRGHEITQKQRDRTHKNSKSKWK